MSGTGGATATMARPATVSACMAEMQNELEQLRNAVSEIEDRLKPVLGPYPPDGIPMPKDTNGLEVVNVVDTLNTQMRTLATQLTRIRALTNRIML